MSAELLHTKNTRITARDGAELVNVAELTLRAGECVAIVGESGAGKSLLAKSLLGLVDPPLQVTRESLVIAGEHASVHNHAQLVRERVGYVNQDALSALDPLMRIEPQVLEALRLQGVPATTEAAGKALEGAGLTATPEVLRAYPHELSGGMRQRALIAAATVAKPSIIVADEPTTALDFHTQTKVLATLRSFVDRGSALLLITHNFEAVRAVADTVLVMAAGQIVEAGNVTEIFTRPQHPATRAMLAAEQPALPGRQSQHETSDGAGSAPRTVAEVRDLTVTFGVGRPAVNGLSFSVASGQTLGIVGASGSGKTTVVKALLGVLGGSTDRSGAVTGKVRVPTGRVRWVPQDAKASFTRGMTVAQVLDEALAVTAGRSWRTRQSRQARKARKARVSELMSQVGLAAELRTRKAERLSGGQAQRLAIARALAAKPELLVCDEPVSGLDPTVRAKIVALLAEAQAADGFAMVYVSHELSSVAQLADEVIEMRRGEAVEKTSGERFAQKLWASRELGLE